MKTTLIFFTILFTALITNGQDMFAEARKADYSDAKKHTVSTEEANADRYAWEFLSAVKAEDAASCSRTDEALFGRDVACLLTLLESQFIRKEQIAAGDPTLHTEIRKPAIYNAVRNIQKYYKRRVKAQGYSTNDHKAFAHVVEVALASVQTDDTNDFEMALQAGKKNPEQQLKCFQQVRLRNIYE